MSLAYGHAARRLATLHERGAATRSDANLCYLACSERYAKHVAGVDELAGLDAATAGPGKHRSTSSAGRRIVPARPAGAAAASQADVFNRFAADYAAEHAGRVITLLQAGCTTAGSELDLAALQAGTPQLAISRVDEDGPAVRAVASSRPDMGAATLAELRSLALAPRHFDLVQCSMLLHRVANAELVAERFVAALRPGGLLLLRTADRETAAGFLDRKLPEFARAMAWRSARPGEPGPFPAYYEPIASARGIEAFVVKHGLAIAHRQRCRGDLGQPGQNLGIPAAQRLVTWFSRGGLVASYDELIYVIRKPEDRFARVLP
jgi:SAM-dependent methyltransferase